LTALKVIMGEKTGLGKTAETYLVGEDGTPLTGLRAANVQPPIKSHGVDRAIRDNTNGAGQYANYRNTPVIGVYRWLPQLRVALLAEQEQSEAVAGTFQILMVLGGLAIVALMLAIGIALAITRLIADPLANLAHTAEQIAAGDWTRVARSESKDEIGALATAFNSMTGQLRHLINSLETQVKERTAQLSASAEVGRAASSILDVPTLISTVVNLITDRFGYYYAAVFLLDESGRYAVLQDGTGEAGRLLKAHGHQLEVGFTSMVGTVIATGQLRTAQHAETETARFVNPLLPDTHSEIALPLRLGGRVIGALDVQSTQPEAFDESSAAVLQNMADQIAVALGNARLYTEIQQRAQEQEGLARIAVLAGSTLDTQALLDRVLAEIRQLFGAELAVVLLKNDAEQALEGRYISVDGAPATAPAEWRIAFDAPGFEQSIFARGGTFYSNQGLTDPKVIPAYRTTMQALQVRNFCGAALRARDQSLGELYVGNRPQGFGAADVSLLQTIAGYAANAIQNAQLFEDSQRRAAREQTINAISGRVRSWLTVDQMLQATVQEIGLRLSAARVAVQLRQPETALGTTALGTTALGTSVEYKR
jgi:GAF domain-containing protein/HAMP domain-containing protein